VARDCQPSTLRMLIWPQASNAQNSMAAVSADGSTVCVLILAILGLESVPNVGWKLLPEKCPLVGFLCRIPCLVQLV
jgi:hypothetical protein